MGEQELRNLLETNFRFLSITMREGAGELSEVRGGLSEVRRELADVKERLESATNRMDDVTERLGKVESGYLAMADRLDEAIGAIGLVAHGTGELRAERVDLRQEVEDLKERVTRLEHEREAS